MNKTFRLYGIIFIIIMVLLALLQINKRQVTDWRKNFDVRQKTPFGMFVFDQEADSLLKGQLTRVKMSPYQYYNSDSSRKSHNIFVFQKEIDQESANKLMEEVSRGSAALIISSDFPEILSHTLSFNTGPRLAEKYNLLKLTDRKLKSDSVVLDKRPGGHVFYNLGKNVEILGTATFNKLPSTANFIKVKLGKGNFYLHSEPLAFTNYYLLKPGSEAYLQDVFSYLPDRPTIWFSKDSSAQSASPLRFILSQPALKYAWWLFLASMLLFVIFNIKRKQRVVPVIEPLQNKSVEFVKSIGNLYLQEGDFHDMMAKKAQYFLHKVRTELLLDTKVLDEHFAGKLNLKTGIQLTEIEEAVVLLNKAQDPYAEVVKQDLMRMNELLDKILR